MLAVLADHFKEQGVTVAYPIRIAAHDIKWGVKSDEGEGDEWPAIREKILAADILIFGTPIWMGQAPSVAKLVMERMDAFLSETDDRGRMPSYSQVEIGRAHVRTPVTNAHIVCRLRLEKKTKYR